MTQLKLWTIRLAAACLLCLSLLSPAAAQDRATQLAEANRLTQQMGQLYEAGRYAEAIPLAERALAIREKVLGKGHPDVANSLNNLAIMYRATSDYARAAPLYQRALAIMEKVLGKEHPDVASALNNLAVLYQAQGDYARAVPLLQRTLAIYEKVYGPEHSDVAGVVHNLASLYQDMGDYARAAPLFQRSLAIREKVFGPEHPDVADSLNNLAALYDNTGDYARAALLYQHALAIREKVLGPEHPDVATTLNNLAILYRATGDYARAAPFYQRALAIDEKALGPEHPDVATDLNNLADLYQAQGDYTRALPLHQRSLAIREKVLGKEHPDVAASLNDLAGLYSDTGDYTRALLLYQRSLAIRERVLGKEHPDVAASLNNLAILYQAQGDYRLAVGFEQRAAEVREKNIVAILDTGSQQQKQLYLNTLVGNTYLAVSLHAQAVPNNADAAQLAVTTILRRKGRALDAFTGQLEALRRRAAPDDKKLLDDLAAVQSQLANLQLGAGQLAPDARRAEVARLEAETERLEDAISRRSAEFRSTRQPITLAAVQAAIPNDAALIELFVYQPFNAKAKGTEAQFGAARYVAYVVRAKDAVPQFVDLGEAAAIDANVARWRALLAPQDCFDAKKDLNQPIAPCLDIEKTKQAARVLDEQIMRPVRKLVGDAKHLLLAPDSALNLIPFAALVDEQGRYLMENYRLTYLTSGRDLLRLQIAGSSQDPATVLAQPLYDARRNPVAMAELQRRLKRPDAGKTDAVDFAEITYRPLAGTAAEAQAMRQLWPEARVWLGAEANERSLKSVVRPRILHIATHGFFFPDQPAPAPADTRQTFANDRPTAGPLRDNPMLRSGLILAGVNQKLSGAGEDGVLTAQEAAGLNLFGTKLVVLSACETGLGDVLTGQGVYGLRRALVLAGSETQIMSLWSVSDTATRDLMTAYYTRLQANEGRTDAMRQVQLAMLRGTALAQKGIMPKEAWRHPYYWAAFIPSGAWTTLDGKEPQ